MCSSDLKRAHLAAKERKVGGGLVDAATLDQPAGTLREEEHAEAQDESGKELWCGSEFSDETCDRVSRVMSRGISTYG